jgi:molecular chaperone DnaK
VRRGLGAWPLRDRPDQGSAKDLDTGAEQSMTITGGSALPADEIERMIRDAEEHAARDSERREEAELRNTAESLLHNADAYPPEQVEAVRKALDDGDMDALKTAFAAMRP